MAHDLKHKIKVFRELNEQGNFILPNAWDSASARIFEATGFKAIGTTSLGIAFSAGMLDGERIGKSSSLAAIANIARSVHVPLNADIEAGYGSTLKDVQESVRAVIEMGVAGINLEDNAPGEIPTLFALNEQTERIAAARAESERQGLSLFINARTDAFLFDLGATNEERLNTSIERGRAYLAAGADMVFVPAVLDLQLIRILAKEFNNRLNIMALPNGPDAGAFFEAGAHRVSIGPIAMLAIMGLTKAIAQEIHTEGSWSKIRENFMGVGEASTLFKKA